MLSLKNLESFLLWLNLQWNAVTELLWLMRKTTENLTKLRTLMFHDALMTLTLYPNRRSAKLEVWQNACVFLFTWRDMGKNKSRYKRAWDGKLKKHRLLKKIQFSSFEFVKEVIAKLTLLWLGMDRCSYF